MTAARGVDAQAGMSLVELIVAIAVSSLLLGLVAVIFGQGLSSQQQSAERNAATERTTAQTLLFNETVRDAVASWYSGARDEVRVRVVDAAGTVRCRAWRVDAPPPAASSHVLAYKEWTPAAGVPSEWTALDGNARLYDDSGTASGPAILADTRSGASPTLKLLIYTNERRLPEEAVASSISLRPLTLAVAGGGACW
ncbi:prepilin-type N-terminal cleavage/methylation domain-containing protein [Leucobacter weissii]|uniref:Prepilin-type N-terminal cleavage/methylation domain-containing protein n=1 Tax=Leucobacter weissii TaxID=1983706 RepID=A0A939MJF8_9MICO|nr:prepilin-type N-terminal cleavage/methylation domain-containing protein [Leucobacter weissii]MBO1901110.1 prepilin-type N-terminal cleavage/methylation domain-containing protein [Leucobacter weissii]